MKSKSVILAPLWMLFPILQEYLFKTLLINTVCWCERHSKDRWNYAKWSRALDYAAFGGSIACVQFLLSKQPKLSPAEKANMIHEALRGACPVEMIGYLLEHARFSLRDWNPVFYKPGEAIPDWAWDLQRRLAVRELGYQAAKRALKHAGMHKDLIPTICQMILKSEVVNW